MRKIEEMLEEEAFAIEKMKKRLLNLDSKFWYGRLQNEILFFLFDFYK